MTSLHNAGLWRRNVPDFPLAIRTRICVFPLATRALVQPHAPRAATLISGHRGVGNLYLFCARASAWTSARGIPNVRLDALVVESTRASATFLVSILREKTTAVCTRRALAVCIEYQPPLLCSAHHAGSLSLPCVRPCPCSSRSGVLLLSVQRVTMRRSHRRSHEREQILSTYPEVRARRLSKTQRLYFSLHDKVFRRFTPRPIGPSPRTDCPQTSSVLSPFFIRLCLS